MDDRGEHYGSWQSLKGPVTNGKGIIPAHICTCFGSDDCIDCPFEEAIPQECLADCDSCSMACPCQKPADDQGRYGEGVFEKWIKLDDLDRAILRALASANEWHFNRTVTKKAQGEGYQEATYRRVAYRLKQLERLGFTERVREKLSQYGRGWRLTEIAKPAAQKLLSQESQAAGC